MKVITEINDEYIDIVKSDMAGAKDSAKTVVDYILNSTAKYHGRCVKSLCVPKLFTPNETALFESIVKTIYGIFDKVIAEYCSNPDYRKLFGFDERLEKLILRQPSYKTNIPIARVDIFLDEKTHDFKFCEFNTDGTSAMNEDRELCTAFKKTKAWQEFSKKHEMTTFELFDSWVTEVGEIYEDYCQRKGEEPHKGHVCITDFMENATENEFVIFRNAFEKAGYTAEICEIRELVHKGGKLLSPSGKAVDIIYRRAVTSDIMAHFDEVTDFIEAVKEGNVCMIGDFRTQIVHNKMIYKVLHDKMTSNLLDDAEKDFVAAHVPYTLLLDDSAFDNVFKGKRIKDDIFENKDNWIIKPEDSYGSKGVHAGVECTDEEWKKYVLENMNSGYILQEFVHPYTTANIDFSKDDEWHLYSNLTGLFVYNKKFAGVYSRISGCEMISTQYSEMALPTFVVMS